VRLYQCRSFWPMDDLGTGGWAGLHIRGSAAAATHRTPPPRACVCAGGRFGLSPHDASLARRALRRLRGLDGFGDGVSVVAHDHSAPQTLATTGLCTSVALECARFRPRLRLRSQAGQPEALGEAGHLWCGALGRFGAAPGRPVNHLGGHVVALPDFLGLRAPLHGLFGLRALAWTTGRGARAEGGDAEAPSLSLDRFDGNPGLFGNRSIWHLAEILGKFLEIGHAGFTEVVAAHSNGGAR